MLQERFVIAFSVSELLIRNINCHGILRSKNKIYYRLMNKHVLKNTKILSKNLFMFGGPGNEITTVITTMNTNY